MGNNVVLKIVDIRDMWLQTENDMMLLLINARHVPYLFFNLISTSKVDDDGYFNLFSDGK